MGFSIDQHPHVFSYWEHIYYKRQQKEIKTMYGVIMESSKPNTQKRTNLGLHVVQHTKVSQKSK
ncbi:hypothetical protein GLYMA_03G182300v4 [Glycine max]|uniref:Uncharacterized protein n=1 Tax=Glycine max TaxID=3847 RepID=A0A0R0KLH0_SOYBN|nr:hypothetical protein GYH30_007615 [Glycine max]KRH67713.1 hypothetical protein GLYMA_03G182300v4 [Glycine max]